MHGARPRWRHAGDPPSPVHVEPQRVPALGVPGGDDAKRDEHAPANGHQPTVRLQQAGEQGRERRVGVNGSGWVG